MSCLAEVKMVSHFFCCPSKYLTEVSSHCISVSAVTQAWLAIFKQFQCCFSAAENPYQQLPCDCHGSMPGKTAVLLGPLW